MPNENEPAHSYCVTFSEECSQCGNYAFVRVYETLELQFANASDKSMGPFKTTTRLCRDCFARVLQGLEKIHESNSA